MRLTSRLLLSVLLLLGNIAFPQQGRPPQSKPKSTFEVASVRVMDPNSSAFVGMSADPSIVRYRNLALLDAIRGAYGVRNFQIVGPDWISTARYDIDAKMPQGASMDQIPEMLQSLLEERFKLAFRRVPKEMQVMAMVVAKDGPKLIKPAALSDREAASQQTSMGTDGKPRPVVFFGGSASMVTITAPSSTILTLVGVITRFTAKPVIDDTGVQGLYKFDLAFFPDDTSSLGPVPPVAPDIAHDPVPSLSDAVKQYGLRIENRKATIDQFVVTRIDKTPTEN